MASEPVQGTVPTSDFPREMSHVLSNPRVRTDFIAKAAFFARDPGDSGENSTRFSTEQDFVCVEATVEDVDTRHDSPQLPACSTPLVTSETSVPTAQAPSAGLSLNNTGILPPNVDVQSFLSTYNTLTQMLLAKQKTNSQDRDDSNSMRSEPQSEEDALDVLMSGGSVHTGDPAEVELEIVNTDFFNKLLDFFAKEEKCSENISDALARAINFRAKVSKDKRDKLVKSYPRPANCPSFKTPRVHKLVWKNMTQSGHDTDVVLQLCQTHSCSAAFPLLRLMDILNAAKMAKRPIYGNEINQCLTLATDAFKMLQFLFSDLSTKRRHLIRDQLNPDFKELCSDDTPVTDDLFGDDLHQRIKDISATQQIGKKLGKSHARPMQGHRHRPSSSGNQHRPPFRYQQQRPVPYSRGQDQRRSHQFPQDRQQQQNHGQNASKRPATFLGGRNKPGKPGKTV